MTAPMRHPAVLFTVKLLRMGDVGEGDQPVTVSDHEA